MKTEVLKEREIATASESAMDYLIPSAPTTDKLILH